MKKDMFVNDKNAFSNILCIILIVILDILSIGVSILAVRQVNIPLSFLGITNIILCIIVFVCYLIIPFDDISGRIEVHYLNLFMILQLVITVVFIGICIF